MRILLVRTSALGDVIHCLPVLRALRRGLPDAHITWVVEAVFAPLLDGHPDLDQIVPVRLRAWRGAGLWSHRGEITSARHALRATRPDVALDLMGNFKGALLARLSGAPRVVGALPRHEAGSGVWLTETVDLPERAVHAVDKARALLPAIGVTPGAVDFGGEHLLTDTPEATRDLLAARDPRRPLVAIQVGAGWPNKVYPPAWWGAVARGLADQSADVWLLEVPGEQDLARRAAEAAGGAARIVDAGPWGSLAALLRASRLLLGGDTGPVHLAHALGTPVLCLVGPTDPARNGPYGARAEHVLFHELPCSRCYKRFDEPKACLLALTPRRVLERATMLLEATEPGAAPAVSPNRNNRIE
ncbi:MAG: glycosyltransferase family 9 protein [Acidobacteriota bacterium]